LPDRIEQLLRRDRRFGSRDRRLYRELLYTAVRHLPWIEPALDRDPDRAVRAIAELAADTPSTHDFRASLRGQAGVDAASCRVSTRSAAGRRVYFTLTPSIAEKAAALAGILGDATKERLLPAWFEAECPEAFVSPNYDVLNTRAPLWLRLQTTDAGPVFAEFTARGWTWRVAGDLPAAIELPGEVDVTRTEAYRLGLIEIQDAGSQRILEAIGLTPGESWLDACAGAGGKTLQLAGLLGLDGRVDASDVRPDALRELGRRAVRAGLADRIARPAKLKAAYDGVLVDAPCSGSGTWRRSPHLKWVTAPARVRASALQQQALLAQFAASVRPGGRLVYATCSLCRSENESIVANFLSAFPSFAPAPFANPAGGEPRGAGLIFWPATHNGDGYFVASLRKER